MKPDLTTTEGVMWAFNHYAANTWYNQEETRKTAAYIAECVRLRQTIDKTKQISENQEPILSSLGVYNASK